MLVVTKEKFDWNSDEQGLVLAAFFYGYCATQIIGGILADKYRQILEVPLMKNTPLVISKPRECDKTLRWWSLPDSSIIAIDTRK